MTMMHVPRVASHAFVFRAAYGVFVGSRAVSDYIDQLPWVEGRSRVYYCIYRVVRELAMDGLP